MRTMLCAAAAMAMAACGKAAPKDASAPAAMVPADTTAPAASPSASPLAGTSWRLVRFESGDESVLTPHDPDVFRLYLGADGQAAIQANCNRATGTWTSAEPSMLTFGPIASTMALCERESIAGRFLRDFEFMRSYVLRDGKLYISLMADGGIWEFEPIPPLQGTFDCGGRGTLVASFNNTVQPGTAEFTLGGRTIRATSAVSGSGARYTADGFEFWEHQGEAAITLEGQKFTCSRSTATGG